MNTLLRTTHVAPVESYPFYRIAHTDDEYSDTEDDNHNFLTSCPPIDLDSDDEEDYQNGSCNIYIPLWVMRVAILLSGVALGAAGALCTHVDSGATA